MPPEEELDFDLEEAQVAGLCSSLSYYPPDSEEHKKFLAEIENHGGISKLKKVVPFYKTKSKNPKKLAGHVMSTEDEIITAYHGTSDLDEVKSDLNILPTEMHLKDGTRILVHTGFKEEFESSNEDRKRATEEARQGKEYGIF